MESFDFIIIGSGSAGSAMAHRLSEDGRHSVLLLEYGGTDVGPLIQMPSALSYPMNMSTYDWGFVAEAEPALGGRRLVTPRGKVIGGSSSINGMVYVRGHARDFDAWEEMGAKGWGFRHVLPYYKRMESSHGGEEGWRGTDGPLHVTRGKCANPLYQAFVEAGRQAGYPVTEDYNGRQQEGFGAMERTIWQGRRWSTANAYLRPALKRSNVKLTTRAFVRRILLEGKRATGVEYERGGDVLIARARREVILAASAINSPIYQLDGQAPDLPADGRYWLADTAILIGRVRLGPDASVWYGSVLRGDNEWVEIGTRSKHDRVDYPDIEYHFLPIAIRYDGKAAVAGHSFQVHVGPMRSKSRGFVKAKSNDPKEAPVIRFNYMSHQDDWAEFRSCIRLTREIFEQDALKPYKGREIQPGEHVQSDAGIDGFVRDHCESAFHPCGTCKMGSASDRMAVVDPECRVIGIEGLRVADSSIMPRITNGNLNAPSIMIGEKASDHILGRDPLPPSNQEPWINPNWKTSQR